MLAAEVRRGTAAFNPIAGSVLIDTHAADRIADPARGCRLRNRVLGMVHIGYLSVPNRYGSELAAFPEANNCDRTGKSKSEPIITLRRRAYRPIRKTRKIVINRTTEAAAHPVHTHNPRFTSDSWEPNLCRKVQRGTANSTDQENSTDDLLHRKDRL